MTKHHSRRESQINWEYLIPPQVGIPTMAYGPAGVGKTKTLETLAKARERRWIRTPLPARQPEDVGGYPDKRDIVIKGNVHQVIKMVELEEMVRARLQNSIMLIDEFTSVNEATQAAALTWMDNPPENCWVFAAGNRMDQATNGNPLAEPMINRMCIVDWKMDTKKWIEGMESGGFDFPAPEVPVVPDDWHESTPLFAKKIVDFLFGKSTYAKEEYACMENDEDTKGNPFPTPRSWTNLSYALGGAISVGASPEVTLRIIQGFVGEHVGSEFNEFLKVTNFVDPEDLLKDPQEVEIPEEFPIAMSYAKSVLRRVRDNLTEERWEAGRKFLGNVYRTYPDLARNLEAKLWDMKPDGYVPEANQELREMEESRLND
tara:strand:+ start:506 stop:1627 length:1122 start_codon:yes stop_codon:yes gene_type:complete